MMISGEYPVLKESNYEYGEWIHECGATVVGKSVTHSIHDGPGRLSGGGQTYTEVVPYCPNCSAAPSSHGAPIRQDPVDVREAEILRNMRGS